MNTYSFPILQVWRNAEFGVSGTGEGDHTLESSRWVSCAGDIGVGTFSICNAASGWK